MKKTLVAVLGMAMMAPMAWAQTNVLSQNAVGYVKITVPGNGGLVLIRHDFENIDGSPSTIASIIGDQMADGTTVFKWDRSAGQYATGAVYTDLGPGLQFWTNDQPIERGDAMFVVNGAGAPATEVYLLGEVPGDNNGAATTPVANSYGFVGYPYPAAVDFDTTDIATQAPDGAVLFRWDPITQNYISPGPVKTDLGPGLVFWTPAGTVIAPGEAFFLDAGGATPSATETKTYAFP